ncbi:quinone oxidoreductase family protein [Nonomuraea sp. SBT364]|uniref:quinone oxidoreductase family protein n=1 Tax=Nonomuraea sp. SBT364 TaxID=1580530 RepID=UPI000A5DB4A8|nr:zinc-binding alcohol dehydrogenase family protein [Nonomuraea sp. SBT364]
MRAAQIRRPGRPPVVAERVMPVPGHGDALVEVLAAPVTPLDVLCASGTSYFGAPAMPYVPGVQGVGVAGGRLVWFPTRAGMAPGDGSMAEVCRVPASALVELPEGADPVAVAALGLSAVAAHMALTWSGELVPGEQVIVLGAGGAVGQAAVQLARTGGARRVVAAVRSPAARARALRSGADAVVDLTTGDQPEPVATSPTRDEGPRAVRGRDEGPRAVGGFAGLEELAGRFVAACDGPADLVIDPLFGVAAAAAARALRPRGRLVHLGSAAADTCPLDSATLRGRSLRVIGYTNNELTAEQQAAAITTIAWESVRGRLSVAHETAPLDDAESAWRRQADGTATGRIVLITPGFSANSLLSS